MCGCHSATGHGAESALDPAAATGRIERGVAVGREGSDGAQEGALGTQGLVLDEALQVSVQAAEDGPVTEAFGLLQQQDLSNLLLDGAQPSPF
jgi:hypothetical protein